MVGRQLDHAQREVADALELTQDPQHRHDEAEVGGHRRLASQEVVAALGERHVHGVDLVVRQERLADELAVAGGQHLAHALEVLVDAHRHQLDLQPELVELAGERAARPTG